MTDTEKKKSSYANEKKSACFLVGLYSLPGCISAGLFRNSVREVYEDGSQVTAIGRSKPKRKHEPFTEKENPPGLPLICN